MVELKPVWIDGAPYTAVEVELPKTHLVAIACDAGYVMCGALDVELLRTRLADRGIVAARAVGVRTLQDLMDGTVDSCTQAAEALGIRPGMPVREALRRMRAAG